MRIYPYINRLNNCSVHYRTVLTLYHLNEFSYQEIEEITGMPEGTVKNYLFRARKLLKEKLELYMQITNDERAKRKRTAKHDCWRSN